MQLPWYVTALGAALVWGIHYPLVEQALRKLSLVGVLVLTVAPVPLLALAFAPALAADARAWLAMGWPERLAVTAPALTSLFATLLLFLSIGSRNAALASLIEITYPLFVVGFAYLLFRELHWTPAVALGALMILGGVSVIVLATR